VENLFAVTGCKNGALSLAGHKINNFILKFYIYLTMRRSDFFWLTIWIPACHGICTCKWERVSLPGRLMPAPEHCSQCWS